MTPDSFGMHPDYILVNALIITFDPAYPYAEILAIKGNRILYTGTKNDLDNIRGPYTKLIDCEGGTVVPGFNDAHCHPLAHAATLLHVNCSPGVVKSIADIKDAVRQKALQTSGNKWIRAANYDELGLLEKRAPNRWELDEAAPSNPVILIHRYGHHCVLNSLALKMAGIIHTTQHSSTYLTNRVKEKIESTGIISDRNKNVLRAIPPLSEEELELGVKLANNEYLSYGITSLQDTSATNGLHSWKRFHHLLESEILIPRISMLGGTESLEDFKGLGLSTGSGSNRLRLGGIKIALDETTDCSHPSVEEITFTALLARKAGFQLAFHTSDIYMLQASLAAIKSVNNEDGGGRKDYRHRLEHCAVCPSDMMQGIRAGGAMVVSQPAFLYYTGQGYLDTFSQDKLNLLFPTDSFKRNGIKVAFSSDSPVVSCNPLPGIYGAVTRKVEGGELFNPQESISVFDALKMYTAEGAYASFEENIKGSITPGKLADLAVLSENLLEITPEKLKDLKVIRTILDGQIVWESS